jgi:hypothetical protein
MYVKAMHHITASAKNDAVAAAWPRIQVLSIFQFHFIS